MTHQYIAAIREAAKFIKLRFSAQDGCSLDDIKDNAARIESYVDTILRVLDEAEKPRPEIVCLCGSTRFYDAFQRMNYELTMQGKIILSVGFYPHSQVQAHGEQIGCTAEQKATLDELHKRKIDLADRVLVLNVGGYIGDSTRSEIEYAQAHDKPVEYLEPGCGRRIQGGAAQPRDD